jgi:hypothetical protein
MAFPVILGAVITGAMTWFFSGSLVLGLVMTGLTLLSSLFVPKPKMQLKPASLSDFHITQANEGQPVPIVYGIVHIPGNIIYYGNLVVEEVKQKVKGGKGGGGSKEVTVGYKYYLDIWQAICHGKIEILDMYIDEDKEKSVQADYAIFNDGTQDTYPTHLEYASRIPGVAHIFWKKFYVGENRTFVPTVKFKVRRILTTGLPHENMSNGSNPAAVVYDILCNYGKLSPSDINIDNFIEAANYYYEQGYGINYVISSSIQAREAATKILEFVDSYLDYDENGKIVIKIFKKTDVPVGTIEDDFINFSFAKPSWNTIPSKFVGNIVEDGVVRTLILENTAVQLYAGQIIREEIDLTAFTDRSIALKRLSEIMKRESYPRIALNLKLPIRYAIYSVGDILTIKNSDIGFSADFRVLSISEPKIDSNEIEMQLIQHTDAKFDNYYQNTGGTLWQEPSYTLQHFTKVKIIELDYLSWLPNATAILILVNKETGFETGFAVYGSQDGTSYELLGICSTFATAGTLSQSYPADTYDIDDEVGIIFKPYKELLDPYPNLPRAGLFSEPRVLVVDDEIMAFQNYDPYGTNEYKITGIVRSLHWTNKASHNAGANAFIADINNNIVQVPYTTNFYIKVVPVFLGTSLDLAGATAYYITNTSKAKKPKTPERIVAVRTGSTVKVDIFPITKESLIGAGKQNADTYTDEYPFNSAEGKWEVTIGSTTVFYDDPHFTVENSSSFVINVRQYYNGMYSDTKSISVGTADGEYIA